MTIITMTMKAITSEMIRTRSRKQTKTEDVVEHSGGDEISQRRKTKTEVKKTKAEHKNTKTNTHGQTTKKRTNQKRRRQKTKRRRNEE